MMHILQFDHYEDKELIRVYNNAEKMWDMLYSLDQLLRSELKHGTEYDEKTLEFIRETLYNEGMGELLWNEN